MIRITKDYLALNTNLKYNKNYFLFRNIYKIYIIIIIKIIFLFFKFNFDISILQ
jgi:hypothetical protein